MDRTLTRSPPATLTARWTLWAGLSLLLPFSACWVWIVGHRGLFVLDESIVFDGAWRIFQGQVPYRDFLIPFGPVTFALSALGFALGGVDFSSLVMTAAALSLLATGAAVRLLWLLTARSVGLTLLGGLMTAVWYQAPFGIPWMEQTAFFFDFVALLLVVEGQLTDRPRWPCLAAAGVASVVAMLSKQNAGGLFTIVCAGSLCLPWRGVRAALMAGRAFLAGAAGAAATFGSWLWIASEPRTFVHYWLELSGDVGLARFAYWKLPSTVFFQSLLGSSVPLFMASSLVGGVVLLVAGFGRAGVPVSGRGQQCAWLALALPQFQATFALTTNNDAANGNAFVGVVVSCTLALLGRLRRGSAVLHWDDGTRQMALPLARRLGLGSVALLLGLAGYSVAEGMIIARGRFVQEFPAGVRFEQRLAVRGASNLLWGEPTHITAPVCSLVSDPCALSFDPAPERRADVLGRTDFERLVRHLAGHGENFFVFPDSTLLYGLIGRVSPQPLLYFHPGQSFAAADASALDRRIVESLQRNEVRRVVLERASHMGTQRRLGDFPLLRRWIETRFRLVEEFGNYRVLEALPDADRDNRDARASN